MVGAEAQRAVRELLRGFMDAWIAGQYAEIRRIEDAGVSPSGVLAPFHDALVPGIRGLGERGFSTTLGNLHERIAVTLAEGAHATVRRAYDLTGTMPVLAREFITQRVDALATGASAPDHVFERQQLLSSFGAEVAAATRIDLSVTTNDGEDHYFEIKSPKPNRGQCIELKRRQLTALAIRRSANVYAYWAVPYNPYGTTEAYAHPFALRFFDFKSEVLLGAPFWNFLGDDGGTYEMLLGLSRDVGVEYGDQVDELRSAVREAVTSASVQDADGEQETDAIA